MALLDNTGDGSEQKVRETYMREERARVTIVDPEAKKLKASSNKEISSLNSNRLYLRGLNPIFLPHELSFDYPITSGTNNPIRPNNKVTGCDFIAT